MASYKLVTVIPYSDDWLRKAMSFFFCKEDWSELVFDSNHNDVYRYITRHTANWSALGEQFIYLFKYINPSALLK